MKFDISFASFVLALIVAASGWFAWWISKIKFDKQQTALDRQQAILQAGNAAEKAVNEKRDFNHLINNQLDISRNMALSFDDVEHLLKEIDNQVREIKAYLIRYKIISDTEVIHKQEG